MYEHDLKYCPDCNDEYRAEIEKCGMCGGPLFTGLEMEARSAARKKRMAGPVAELSIDEELVVIRRGKLAEIKVFEKLLAEQHIGTLLAGDENSCGKGCCGGNFDLVVRREDAEEASHLIDEEIRCDAIGADGNSHGDAVFNPEVAESTCPACGHVFKTAPECPDCGLCF
ncbi:MAG: hypothetical protein KKG47_14630 [Proteobacteria bacterium]|nr:hypothetical protein [Pseudomonadota bacterium]